MKRQLKNHEGRCSLRPFILGLQRGIVFVIFYFMQKFKIMNAIPK